MLKIPVVSGRPLVENKAGLQPTWYSWPVSYLIFFFIKIVFDSHIIQDSPAFTCATSLLGVKVRQHHAFTLEPLPICQSELERHAGQFLVRNIFVLGFSEEWMVIKKCDDLSECLRARRGLGRF